jgi:hypothetical protein
VRGYEKLESEAFMAEINKFVSSDVDLKYVPVTPIKKSATTLPPKKNPNKHNSQNSLRCSASPVLSENI